MPGARNRIARALVPVHRALQSGRAPASADAGFILPCRDRVVTGDRIRWTMLHGESLRWRIEGDMPRLDGIVVEVGPVMPMDGEVAKLRVEARSGERGPAPGEMVWMHMDDLRQHDCVRAVWADEDERARIEARDRSEAAERERIRDRHMDRGEDLGRTL